MRRTALLPSMVLLALLSNTQVGAQSPQSDWSENPAVRQAQMNLQSAQYWATTQPPDHYQASKGYFNVMTTVQDASTSPQWNQSCRVDGMTIAQIGRKALEQTLAAIDQVILGQAGVSTAVLTDQLQRLYGRMQAAEPSNPTWYYLDAVLCCDAGNYWQANNVLQKALDCPGGQPSVKAKAQALKEHIKPGWQAQERMRQGDVARYEEYVASGKQSLDFAIVGATQRARQLREKGDILGANTVMQRAIGLRAQRMRLGP